MLRLLTLPFSVVAGTRRWWIARGKRYFGVNRVERPLNSYKWGRGLKRAYENHATVRYLVDQFADQLPFRRRYLYYRGTLRRTVEFRNVWSRGVVGGFVNRHFVGKQPPTHHGSTHGPLQGEDLKLAIMPRKRRRPPPNVRGAARYRQRLKRSGLGV